LLEAIHDIGSFGDEGETVEINGVAHIFLTASNFERSRGFIASCCRF
jgi:hypothetical protein